MYTFTTFVTPVCRLRVLFAALGLVLTPYVMTPASAGQASAVIPVSVVVIAGAKLQNLYETTQLTITELDISRGYISIQSAYKFSVLTNSKQGVVLELNPIGYIFNSVEVTGWGNISQLGPDGGSITQRGTVLKNETHELSFKFQLRHNNFRKTIWQRNCQECNSITVPLM